MAATFDEYDKNRYAALFQIIIIVITMERTNIRDLIKSSLLFLNISCIIFILCKNKCTLRPSNRIIAVAWWIETRLSKSLLDRFCCFAYKNLTFHGKLLHKSCSSCILLIYNIRLENQCIWNYKKVFTFVDKNNKISLYFYVFLDNGGISLMVCSV